MAAKLSTKVLSMRFMQKSFEKKRAEELALNAQAEDAEEHWVSHQRSGDEGCVVLLEGDPPPANGSGRMSFQGFKTAPKTAYNMQPTEAADGDREGDGQEGVSVVDEVMAARCVFFKLVYFIVIPRLLIVFTIYAAAVWVKRSRNKNRTKVVVRNRKAVNNKGKSGNQIQSTMMMMMMMILAQYRRKRRRKVCNYLASFM